MYLILKQQKKNIIVKNIEDYFNSNIGGLYQIKGLLETINDVLNIKSNKDTILKCQNAIDILKDKSAKLNYKFHENYYSYFDKARSKAGGKSMIKAINKLIDYINKIVQNHTRQFIKDNHINFKKFISK
jgi:phage-related tail protein